VRRVSQESRSNRKQNHEVVKKYERFRLGAFCGLSMRGRYWGNFSPQALLRVASVKVSRNRVLKKICDIPMCSRSRNSFKGSFIFVSSRNKGVIENKPKAVEKKKIAKSGKPRRRVPEQWPLYGLSISGSEASLKIV